MLVEMPGGLPYNRCPSPPPCAAQELLRQAGRLLLRWLLNQPLPAAPGLPPVPAALLLPLQHHLWQPAHCGGEWLETPAPLARTVSGPSRFEAPTRGSWQRRTSSPYQQNMHLTSGSTPILRPRMQAKGNASEFSCGAPLSFWAPEVPGFTKMPGRGLFLYGQLGCIWRLPAGGVFACPDASVHPCLPLVNRRQLQLHTLHAPWVGLRPAFPQPR